MSRALQRLKPTSAASPAAAPLRPRKPLLQRPELPADAQVAAAPTDSPSTEPSAARVTSRRLTEYAILAIAGVAVICGYALGRSDIFVPYEGAGYYLGIAGGLGMALQLLYGSAKRLRILHSYSASRALFHLHMIVGLGAPIAILYHCRFSWGARNSNVALVAMLLVVASGLTGRMIVRKVEASQRDQGGGNDPRQLRSERLRAIVDANIGGTGWLVAERLSALTVAAETSSGAGTRSFWMALGGPFRIAIAKLECARLIRGAVIQNATQHGWSASEQSEMCKLANRQAAEFLSAHGGVPAPVLRQTLLSSWHLLHAPLFYFLVLAGIVHVVSVHWY
jgi:hypothetical protein